MTIVYMKNGKEATAEECLIQRKFFCLSSLEYLCNAAYPIYDKYYIKTLLRKAILENKVITNIYFTEEKEPHKTAKIFTSMDIEEMQRLLFPNQNIQDISYKGEDWDKLYTEAVITLEEWNEAEKVKQEQENKHEKHDDMMSYMNAVYDANKIVATPPCEIFNRVAIIPNLAISIEDLEVVLRHNGLLEEAQEIEMLIDKLNKPIIDKARKGQSKGGKSKLLKAKKFFEHEFNRLRIKYPDYSPREITSMIWNSNKLGELKKLTLESGRRTLTRWQNILMSGKSLINP